MQKTAWAAGAPRRTPLGELTALLQIPQLMGRGWLPTPALGLSGLACLHRLIFQAPELKS